jgi:hypothetical protein
MRFCNEFANIGTFGELTTVEFKIIGYFQRLLGKGNACNHFHSNTLFLGDILL